MGVTRDAATGLEGEPKGKGAFRAPRVQPEQLALQAGAVVSVEAGDT